MFSQWSRGQKTRVTSPVLSLNKLCDTLGFDLSICLSREPHRVWYLLTCSISSAQLHPIPSNKMHPEADFESLRWCLAFLETPWLACDGLANRLSLLTCHWLRSHLWKLFFSVSEAQFYRRRGCLPNLEVCWITNWMFLWEGSTHNKKPQIEFPPSCGGPACVFMKRKVRSGCNTFPFEGSVFLEWSLERGF